MHSIVPTAQINAARHLKQLLSTYHHNRDLIAIGAYHAGSDPRIDAAISAWPSLQTFLQQDLNDSVSIANSVAQLDAFCGETT
jgi:flagellum-specific ATP synthase